MFCNQRYREIYAHQADLMMPGRSFAEILRIGAQHGQHPAAVGRVDEWIAEQLAHHHALSAQEQQLSNGRWIRSTDQRSFDGGIVGIRTDVAQTIVTLGINLGDIVTRADLEDGIRYALR